MRIPKNKKENSTKGFTPNEDMLLMKRYGRVSWTELKSLFPNHSIEVVISHAEDVLGLKRDFPGCYPRTGTGNSWYNNFGYCRTHGKILIKDLKRDSGGGLVCPHCNKRIRTRPRNGEYKKKYIKGRRR